ncbi:MAG: hypothetical protein QF436_03190 [Candidatus Woesearchaeota archaeon]|jgi:hypothetical protein|nr:hypothetical protein [Candidatus Woesearchaeota archaeon]MDP7623094.1 hypothetical protein [Candidatus Woesearchaeota archaeon]HJN56365.1 hypothetical protein [Candidatus Woesearchaeota archaeon]|tara:strand:+ start:857 stop:1687 length:831 start_codon:yes stop_codon:yes gene_type:complete
MGIDNLNNNFQEKSNLSFNDSFNQDKKQSKKPIIISSVVFLIIVIGLIIIFYPSSEDKAEDKASSVIVQEARTADDVIHEGSEDESQEAVTVLEYSAKEIKEIDECAQKYVDLDYLALLEDDVSICIDGADPRLDYSIYEEDPIECSDYYYLIKAVLNNDLNICDKSSTSDNTLACRGILTKDLSSCMKFDGADGQSFCNAYLNDNPSICKKLSNEDDILSCEEDFYLVDALASNDKDNCLKYEDGDNFQSFCLSLFEGNSNVYMNKLKSLCVTSE